MKGIDPADSRAVWQRLQERTFQLSERVKELQCLYSISQLHERNHNMPLDEFIQHVLELIPPAWQFPELCSAQIQVGTLSFKTEAFQESTICLRASINLEGQAIGEILVNYASLPSGSISPFLKEEAILLDSISNAVGRAVGEFYSRQRLADYQERLRSLASELALAGERERRRMAQQLHNEIGHKLAMLKFKLGDAQRIGSESLQRELIQLVESTIDSTRNLTFELSPPVLHELGLGSALEWLTHQLESNYGIHCEFTDDRNPKPLSEDIRVELFQAVKELLVNIRKHSKASKARLEVFTADGHLHITVSDNGVGFETNQSPRGAEGHLGWGLFGLRERLGHLGARVSIESAPLQGVTVRIVAPLEENVAPKVARSEALPELPLTRQQPGAIRIIIADDQQLTRAGICALLTQMPGIEIVAEATDGEEVIEMAVRLKPNVILMDVAMPKLDGIKATERILEANPQVKVIGLSMHADRQFVVEMLRAGASGYLLKDCGQRDLLQAISVVNADFTFLSPGLARGVAANYVREGSPDGVFPAKLGEELKLLTPREIEVLTLIAHGSITKEIARHLSISVKTVEAHRQHIMEKLDLHSVADLTKFALRNSLIQLVELPVAERIGKP